jgi:uncharacterized protein (TIGR00369 family)
MGWAKERLAELKAGGASLPPIVETLRMGGLDDWGEGWVKKRWTPVTELATADGALFGGYLAALADQALAFAAMTVAPEDAAFRTLNLQLNFLRVTPAQALDIEARVVAKTRQVITLRVEFRREDGELIAEATAQQLVVPFR